MLCNDRWSFHTCKQLESENFDIYLVRLNKIIENCQYEKIIREKMKETMLWDQIIFGISNTELKKKFLKENPEKLKLQDVIDQCKVYEITESKFKQMNQEEKSVNEISKKKLGLKRCKFCNKKYLEKIFV